MQTKKSNYRLEKTPELNELYKIFDSDNGEYGKGITLQFQVLSKISAEGHWLDSYMLGSRLVGCVLMPDKTINKYIIDSSGNYSVEKIPTLTLYSLPETQFHSPACPKGFTWSEWSNSETYRKLQKKLQTK